MRQPDLGSVANVLVIALVVYAVARPEGPLGARVVRWRQERAVIARTMNDWTNLATGSRLDTLSAPAALVEFSDYQCPYCRKQHEPLSALLASSTAMGVTFRHLPLAIHPSAEGAARTAICGERQGRFLQVHDRLMTSDLWMRDTNWVREAEVAGVTDLKAFELCLRDSSTTQRLEADMSLARELGINGTPTFLYRGGRQDGMIPDTMYRRLFKASGQ
jgi:protein-disulfide isomerase